MRTYTNPQQKASKKEKIIPATPEDGRLYREWGNYFSTIGRHVQYTRCLNAAHKLYYTHVCAWASVSTHTLTGDTTRKRRYAMAAHREARMMGVSVRTIFRWRKQLREAGLMTRAPSSMYEPAPHWVNMKERDIECSSGVGFRPTEGELFNRPLYDRNVVAYREPMMRRSKKGAHNADCALIDAQIRLDTKRKLYHSGRLE